MSESRPRLALGCLAGVAAGLLTACAGSGAGVQVAYPLAPRSIAVPETAARAQDPVAQGPVVARQDDEPKPPPQGYPPAERQVGGPTDVEADLATSFPKQDSVLSEHLLPQGYFEWKQSLYEATGIKLAASYQTLFQYASDKTDGFPLPGRSTQFAAGGWAVIEGRWEAINPGEDWQGGITAALDWRHGFGDAAEPSSFQAEHGSLWPTDFVQVQWSPWFPVLYWEQWGKRDRFVARIGNQTVPQIFDFFRFKDARTSFTGTPMTLPAASMPFPAPGLGASFEWWPIEDSTLYVVGTMNDMNAEPPEFTWDRALRDRQFFYGVEVGYKWQRSRADFDHLHLDLFWADERNTALPVFPNSSGGGFKLAGSKQIDRFVGFANYTYNDAQGGGFGATTLQHAANAGVAYLKPLGVRGELALGASWGAPQSLTTAPPAWRVSDDQYGLEAYWKILLAPDLWITPGVQMIADPAYDPDNDLLTIAQFKFRLFF